MWFFRNGTDVISPPAPPPLEWNDSNDASSSDPSTEERLNHITTIMEDLTNELKSLRRRHLQQTSFLPQAESAAQYSPHIQHDEPSQYPTSPTVSPPTSPQHQRVSEVQRSSKLTKYRFWTLFILVFYIALTTYCVHNLRNPLHKKMVTTFLDTSTDVDDDEQLNEETIQTVSTEDASEAALGRTKWLENHIESEEKTGLSYLEEKCRNFKIKYKKMIDPGKVKPIWFAFFPGTLPLPVYRDFIQTVTGLQGTGKSFYSRAPTIQRCISSKDMSITCQTVHPTVPMEERLIRDTNYESSVRILALRNPMTAIPFHVNEKQHLYHNLPPGEQVSIELWRSIRDEHFSTLLQNWIDTISTWVDSAKNKDGTSEETNIVYIPHESMSDPILGPQKVSDLLKEFHRLNIPITTKVRDATCLWYNFYKTNPISVEYEYTTYQPGYTIQQKNAMMTALQTLLNNQSTYLKTILQQYHDIILHECPIDGNAKTND